MEKQGGSLALQPRSKDRLPSLFTIPALDRLYTSGWQSLCLGTRHRPHHAADQLPNPIAPPRRSGSRPARRKNGCEADQLQYLRRPPAPAKYRRDSRPTPSKKPTNRKPSPPLYLGNKELFSLNISPDGRFITYAMLYPGQRGSGQRPGGKRHHRPQLCDASPALPMPSPGEPRSAPPG